MAPLNILTLNIQGFNTPHKCIKALRTFAAVKAHIICLQKTNFTEKCTPKYLSASYPQFYAASATTQPPPKPLPDLSSWANYRPISLLNLNIKLLAKIMATHLNTIIGHLIHRGQTGFVTIRQAGDNIRYALLLSHTAKTRCIPTCFLFPNMGFLSLW